MTTIGADGLDRGAGTSRLGPHRRLAGDGALARLSIAVLFIGALSFVYITWLSVRYPYMGFPFVSPSWLLTTVAIFGALAPAVYLPAALRKASDFYCWMIYFFVYVPSIIIPAYQGYLNQQQVMELIFSLLVGFLMISNVPRFTFRVNFLPAISKDMFWVIVFVAYAVIISYVLFIHKNAINLVSFGDVYGQRELGGELQDGTLTAYALGLIGGAINPFLLSHGVYKKNINTFAIGSAGQLLVYATLAYKAAILSIVFIPFFYYFTLSLSSYRHLYRVGIIILSLVSVPMIMYMVPGFPLHGLMDAEVLPLIYMRTFGMTGALTGVYANFFTQNPITWFSHINVVHLFLPYPYGAPLGVEVGRFLTHTEMDANANFFATDGIAALGLLGPIGAGLLMGLLLRFVDRWVGLDHLAMFCAASTTTILQLANNSMFTTMLTGGLGALLLLFGLWQKSELEPTIRRAMRPGAIRGGFKPTIPPTLHRQDTESG